MKTLRLILAFLALGLAITSCQKDFSFEAGNAKGSLGKTTAGDCDPILVNGLYYEDTTLNTNNFVDVQIDFTKIGIYNIKTDTINGYSFVGSGSTGTLGLQTVRLLGKGKPLAAGFDIFTVTFDGSQCSFSVAVTALPGGGGGGGNAIFTFGSSSGACTGAVLGGTYTSGVTMSATNNVTIPVTVITNGTYNITTTANGVTFSGMGNLTTATTSITLTATGTPAVSTTAVTTPYPITSGTSNCSFDVPYLATPSGGNAAFTFTCGASSPIINGTYTVGVPVNSTNYVVLPISLTTAGNFTISTSLNGVTFSATGFLPASATSVTLLATGEPSTPGTPTFTVAYGTSNCMFTPTFNPSGTLTFQNGGVTKNFNFSQVADTSATPAIPPLPAGFGLEVEGFTNSTSTGESLNFVVFKPTTYFTNMSSYNVNSIATFVLVDVTYTDNSGTEYTITSDIAPQLPGFTINIATITPTRVIGTFSGTLKSMGGLTYVVNNGNFDLPLQ
jgi:hypothetical protein